MYTVRNSKLDNFWSAAKAIIMRLHRRVIRQSNGNFVDFKGIILKIVKIHSVRSTLHFCGKWQNPENCELPCMGKSEAKVHYIEVTLVHDHQFAHNTISLTSNLYWGQRLISINPCLCSKIWSMTKWPLCSLKCQNAIAIWYLNENELICDFRGHIGLKQPRNYKFKFGWAW